MIKDVVLDYDDIQKNAAIDKLNTLKPSPRAFDGFVEAVYTGKGFADAPVYSGVGGNISDLQRFKHYYYKVTEIMPSRADAYGMTGFCYFHLGQIDEAIDYYKKASDKNPNFFWYHYNLGIIYFKNKQFLLANEVFEKALLLKPEETIIAIKKSVRIYHPIIFRVIEQFKIYFNDELKDARVNARTLLILSYYQSGLKLRNEGLQKESLTKMMIAKKLLRGRDISVMRKNMDLTLKIY